MIAIDGSNLMSRLGALAVLAAFAAVLSPVVTVPVTHFLETRDTLLAEEALLAKAQERLATVTRLARHAPIIAAKSREEAVSKMVEAITSAVPASQMRILSLNHGAAGEGEAKRIDVMLTAEATPAGVAAFARTLATGATVLRVTQMSLNSQSVPGPETQGQPVRLAVLVVVSGLFASEVSR